MNHNWGNAFITGGDLKRSSVSDHTLICPKPRRIGLHNTSAKSLQCYYSGHVDVCESKAETDILDLILTKDGYGSEHKQLLDSPSPFLCGSPPSRVANPLTKDARFRDDFSPIPSPLGQQSPLSLSPSSLGRKGGGCVRGNFGNSPAIRIEGFDCLDRDSRNCSIPGLA